MSTLLSWLGALLINGCCDALKTTRARAATPRAATVTTAVTAAATGMTTATAATAATATRWYAPKY